MSLKLHFQMIMNWILKSMLINLVQLWKKILKNLNKKELINHQLKEEINLKKKLWKSQRLKNKKPLLMISKSLKFKMFLLKIIQPPSILLLKKVEINPLLKYKKRSQLLQQIYKKFKKSKKQRKTMRYLKNQAKEEYL